MKEYLAEMGYNCTEYAFNDSNGVNVWVVLVCTIAAGMIVGLITGLFHTCMGIPPILAAILTQLSLHSINLAAMGGKANQVVSVRKREPQQQKLRGFALGDRPNHCLRKLSGKIQRIRQRFTGHE